jgi:hypothetical protein
LGDGGMLSAGKFKESGQLSDDRNCCLRIMRQGRALLKQLEREVGERVAGMPANYREAALFA